MKDNAVTPVVGVMLLISITIIAVAVFSAFAGGLIKTTEGVTSADIRASASGSGDNFKIIFEHEGGDILSTEDVKVTTLIKTADPIENSFYLSELKTGAWMAGDIITTTNLSTTYNFLGTYETELKNEINKSTPLEIKMYHTPTSTIIYQSTILLEEK